MKISSLPTLRERVDLLKKYIEVYGIKNTVKMYWRVSRLYCLPLYIKRARNKMFPKHYIKKYGAQRYDELSKLWEEGKAIQDAIFRGDAGTLAGKIEIYSRSELPVLSQKEIDNLDIVDQNETDMMIAGRYLDVAEAKRVMNEEMILGKILDIMEDYRGRGYKYEKLFEKEFQEKRDSFLQSAMVL